MSAVKQAAQSSEQRHWEALSRYALQLHKNLIYHLVTDRAWGKAGIRLPVNDASYFDCSYKWIDKTQTCRVAVYTENGVQLINDRVVKNRLMRLGIQILKRESLRVEMTPRIEIKVGSEEDWKEGRCVPCGKKFKYHLYIENQMVCPDAGLVSSELDWENIPHSA